MGSLLEHRCVLSRCDADLQHVRHPVVRNQLRLGRVLVHLCTGMLARCDSSLRRLRNSDMRRLRTMGNLHRPKRMRADNESDLQHLWHPDLHRGVRLRSMLVRGNARVHAEHFSRLRKLRIANLRCMWSVERVHRGRRMHPERYSKLRHLRNAVMYRIV